MTDRGWPDPIQMPGSQTTCRPDPGLRCRPAVEGVRRSQRESVQAKLRLMVKRILRKYRYPPDRQDEAIEPVLQQAEVLGEAWV